MTLGQWLLMQNIAESGKSDAAAGGGGGGPQAQAQYGSSAWGPGQPTGWLGNYPGTNIPVVPGQTSPIGQGPIGNEPMFDPTIEPTPIPNISGGFPTGDPAGFMPPGDPNLNRAGQPLYQYDPGTFDPRAGATPFPSDAQVFTPTDPGSPYGLSYDPPGMTIPPGTDAVNPELFPGGVQPGDVPQDPNIPTYGDTGTQPTNQPRQARSPSWAESPFGMSYPPATTPWGTPTDWRSLTNFFTNPGYSSPAYLGSIGYQPGGGTGSLLPPQTGLPIPGNASPGAVGAGFGPLPGDYSGLGSFSSGYFPGSMGAMAGLHDPSYVAWAAENPKAAKDFESGMGAGSGQQAMGGFRGHGISSESSPL